MKKYLLFLCLFFLINLTSCATQTNPEAASLNTKLGIAYLKENQFSRAKEKLLLAEKQAPHSPEVLDALAYFYETTGRFQLANDYYIQALSFSPNAPDILNNYAVFLCKQKQYTFAIEYFLKAANLQANLNPAETYRNAGFCALKIPDAAQAKRYFQLALQNSPDHPGFR